jgi:glutathione peroxidase
MRLPVIAAVAVSALACASPVMAAPANAGAVVPAADRGAPLLTGTYDRLDGKRINLASLRGRVVMVVNTASHCGFTGQYAGLQKLYDKYKDQGLVVLGFPSGDFGGQEFSDSKEIREFCTTKYSVTFPMFEKCVVKAGEIGRAA